jgi:hypothetical protein
MFYLVGGGFNIDNSVMYTLESESISNSFVSIYQHSSTLSENEKLKNSNIFNNHKDCKLFYPSPIYVHEVHMYIYSSDIYNLNCIESLARINSQQIAGSLFWCCNIVDVYIYSQFPVEIVIACQVGYSSQRVGLSRSRADEICKAMETELPKRMKLR